LKAKDDLGLQLTL